MSETQSIPEAIKNPEKSRTSAEVQSVLLQFAKKQNLIPAEQYQEGKLKFKIPNRDITVYLFGEQTIEDDQRRWTGNIFGEIFPYRVEGFVRLKMDGYEVGEDAGGDTSRAVDLSPDQLKDLVASWLVSDEQIAA